MKKFSSAFLLLVLVFALAACARRIPHAVSPQNTEHLADGSVNASHPDAGAVPHREPEDTEEGAENKIVMEEQMERKLILSVNGTPLNVRWENNHTVDELIAYAQTENIVVDTTRYGGFEQVGSLPKGFPRNDVQMTTEPGDIVLYSGNQLVTFFGSNSWSYTKLGHIEGLSGQELSELLGADSAVIEIKLN